MLRAVPSIAIALAGITTAGCGSLNVTMEILDPATLKGPIEESVIAAGIPKLSVATDEVIEQSVRDLSRGHREIYQALAKKQAAAAAKATGAAASGLSVIAASQGPSFDRLKGPYYAALQRDLQRYRNDLRATLGDRYSVRPGEPGYQRVLEILREWQQRVRQSLAVINDDIRALGKLPDLPGESLLAARAIDVAAADIKSGLEQISIQNSPYAYYVAQAPDGSWKRYNDVYSTGRFGATDVAIKLDSKTGNYLLKGLSFDPSDVAAVASKVATQSLLLAAQVAGVPAKSASPPADGTAGKALGTSSSALTDAQAGLETKRAQELARKAALLAIANAIVNEEKELGGDDERRRAAVLAIRAAFDARSAILRPASTTP
jgi:hypothetical protein